MATLISEVPLRCRFRACGGENPCSNRHDQAGCLGNRNENVGRDVAKRRMFPAQQGFAADRASRARINNRLIFEMQLAIRQRELKLVLERSPALVLVRKRCDILNDLSPTPLLGLV